MMMLAALALIAGAPPGDALLDELAAGHPELRALATRYPSVMRQLAAEGAAQRARAAPVIPGTPWRIHDIRRPQPRVVKPGRCDHAAPKTATRLLDGSGLSGWSSDRLDDWIAADGVLRVGGKHGNMLVSAMPLGDARIHVEWRAPDPPHDEWQHRGNSGIYLMGRYEVQVLDSYRNPTYPDGQAGAVYGQYPPRVNASRPPGEWQCYDIVWTAPRFDGARLAAPARLTLRHNGILVQDDVALFGGTAHNAILPYLAHDALPLQIQDHGDAAGRVEYRNIWVQPLDAAR